MKEYKERLKAHGIKYSFNKHTYDNYNDYMVAKVKFKNELYNDLKIAYPSESEKNIIDLFNKIVSIVL